jgi:hypothetical protein
LYKFRAIEKRYQREADSLAAHRGEEEIVLVRDVRIHNLLRLKERSDLIEPVVDTPSGSSTSVGVAGKRKERKSQGVSQF